MLVLIWAASAALCSNLDQDACITAVEGDCACHWQAGSCSLVGDCAPNPTLTGYYGYYYNDDPTSATSELLVPTSQTARGEGSGGTALAPPMDAGKDYYYDDSVHSEGEEEGTDVVTHEMAYSPGASPTVSTNIYETHESRDTAPGVEVPPGHNQAHEQSHSQLPEELISAAVVEGGDTLEELVVEPACSLCCDAAHLAVKEALVAVKEEKEEVDQVPVLIAMALGLLVGMPLGAGIIYLKKRMGNAKHDNAVTTDVAEEIRV